MYYIPSFRFILSIILLIIGLLLCCGAGIKTLMHMKQGLGSTGLNDRVVWGLNIQAFYIFSCCGCGILMMLSVLILFFGGGLSRGSIMFCSSVALGLLGAGIILMGADLGRPERALKIIAGKNFMSPLTLDFATLSLLVVISLIWTLGIGVRHPAFTRIVGCIALLSALLCMVSHTLLLAPKFGAGFRSHPFNSLETTVCAMMAGAALLTLLTGTTMFSTILLVLTAVGFTAGIGDFFSARLARDRDHTLPFTVLCALAFLCLAVYTAGGFGGLLLPVIASILTLLAIVAEKSISVLHIQKPKPTPMPYSQLDPETSYRATSTEITAVALGVGIILLIPQLATLLRIFVLH